MRRRSLFNGLSIAALIWTAAPSGALAQQAGQVEAEAEEDETSFLNEVVVTGVFRPGANRLESSVSTSSLNQDEIQYTAPRTTTEIFRSIPGLRVEASGGDNNANIQVRGTPLTEGGAKFVQLQEDGLPLLQFGDIIFGNADNFLRADSSVSGVEAIRGGSASTAASNAPGAVINITTKTGETEGGSIAFQRGLNFDTTRVDFEYGSPFGEFWNFHVGGFFRTGEGPRDVGFTGERGGQIRANVTRRFSDDNGFFRLYFKHLNDRVHVNLPQPLLVSGTDLNPTYSPLPGFDAGEQQLSTSNFTATPRVDGNQGEVEVTDFTDGSRVLYTSLGFEFEREVGPGVLINNKFRYADVSSQFTGLLSLATFDAATAAATLFPGEGASLAANGAPIPDAALPTLNGNGLIVSNLVFDSENDDLSSFQNDLRLTKAFDLGGFGDLDVTVGYYKNVQQIEQDYFFSELLLTVDGDNADVVDVLDADGAAITTDGFTAFGTFDPTFDLEYDRDAVFTNFGWTLDRLSIDLSARYETISATGNSTEGGGPSAQTPVPFDINNDGVIDPAEEAVNLPVTTALNPIDYVADYFSYSFGVNYLVMDNLALFARYSEGASANADRLVIGAGGGAFINPDGSLADEDVAIDRVEQVEAGVKWNVSQLPIPGQLDIFATFFYAETEENTGSAGGTGDFIFSLANEFESIGVEWESQYSSEYLDISGGFTFSDSEIVASDDPAFVGSTPQRNADFIYQVTPVGKLGSFIGRDPRDLVLGSSIIGTTSSFTEAPNGLIQPGFVQVNFFANYNFSDRFSINFNINNAFDEFGITEVEEDVLADGLAAPALGGVVVRGRPINGRTATVGLVYEF